MTTDLPRIDRPELVFGFVAPIGADLDHAVDQFDKYFRNRSYEVVKIKVTDVFKRFKARVEPNPPLVKSPLYDRYETFITYGNNLRKHFFDNSLLAKTSIFDIVWHRNRLQRRKLDTEKFRNTVYLLSQFKRKEEIEIFREVYGRLFFQVSIYSRRSARIDYLARRFAHTENSSDINSFRDKAESLVQRDMEEIDLKTGAVLESGQSVGKIFHDADFIINSDISEPAVEQQVSSGWNLTLGALV